MILQHDTTCQFNTTCKYGHVYSLAITTTSTSKQNVGHYNRSEHHDQKCCYFTSLEIIHWTGVVGRNVISRQINLTKMPHHRPTWTVRS